MQHSAMTNPALGLLTVPSGPEVSDFNASFLQLGDRFLTYTGLSQHINYHNPLPDTSVSHSELFNWVIHPYSTIDFERLLTKHDLLDCYPHLIHNLTHGFPLGRLPILDHTIVISNHMSAREHPKAVAEYLETELGANRMSGPFSLSEMEAICRGPFFASPLIVAIQDQGPGLPPNKRVCCNLSKDNLATFHPSVNAFINKEDFLTRFDSPFIVADLVASSPPGTQACAFDIKSFHRTCPVLPDHKPFLVVSVNNKFYLDHCFPFGVASASSNTGQICNALVDIWCAETQAQSLGRLDTLKYKDDLSKIRFPVQGGPCFAYAFDRKSVLSPIDCLGVPWHPTKMGSMFVNVMTFIGFQWDFPRRQVSLPNKKRLKFLGRVQTILNGAQESKKFSLLEIQQIHGS
ncbi:unnamed protein product, partial [Mycena citricolor]